MENSERVKHIERIHPTCVSEEVSSHINRLKETEKETCVSIVDEFCDISNMNQDIEREQRIGRRRSGEFRPVVVFLSFRIREKVRSNASRLGGTRFGIQKQFPRHIQEQRKQLYPTLKDAKKRGERATLVVN